MSIPTEPSAGNLQFDQAEFTANAPERPACAGCKEPIADQYYEAAGQLICPACRGRFENAMHGGSGLKRGLKALGLGLVAAAIGSAAYYAIMHATGLNIGLVAIVLGILIGGAVKMGSEGRGGWFYQLLALFLTYTAISAMHIPDIITGLQEIAEQESGEVLDAPAPQVVTGGIDAPADANADQEGLKRDETPDAGAEAETEAPAPPSEAASLEAETDIEPHDDAAMAELRAALEQPPSALDMLLGTGVLLILAYALPVFIAIESPISGLIYAFALWEAWKLNKKTHVAFNGPYSLTLRDSVGSEGAADGV